MKSVLPECVEFADLAREREPVTLRLVLLPAPIGALFLFNGLEPDEILASGDLSCELICEWYVEHITACGDPDPVAEAILAEVAEEQVSGVATPQVGGGRAH